MFIKPVRYAAAEKDAFLRMFFAFERTSVGPLLFDLQTHCANQGSCLRGSSGMGRRGARTDASYGTRPTLLRFL